MVFVVLLSTFRVNIKISVEPYADCFIFTNAGTYDAAISDGSIAVMRFYCFVSLLCTSGLMVIPLPFLCK